MLEQDVWRTSNWPLEPVPCKEQARLTDILVFVPGFLEEKVYLDREDDAIARNHLIRRVETQLLQLYKWRWEWDEVNNDAVREEAKSRCYESSHAPFLTSLNFSALSLASEILLYNAVHLWLLELLCKFILNLEFIMYQRISDHRESNRDA